MPRLANEFWIGFADAKPNEAIQKHALAVAVVFSSHPKGELLELPVKQYKDSRCRHKARDAGKLAEWLKLQKSAGLKLSGFVSVVNQFTAARFGMEMIEELPDTVVVEHFNGYRLQFGSEFIDLAQAVALGFYYSIVSFGVIRPAASLPVGRKKLFVAMDRFPGASIGPVVAGQSIPPTQGQKFLNFLRRKSATGIGMDATNALKGIEFAFGTLDWWKRQNSRVQIEGKKHPNFALTDWLLAGAIANTIETEFDNDFSNEDVGIKDCEALQQLYHAFKKFDLWSIDDAAMQHIRPSNSIWSMSEDARNFILARTGTNPPQEML